MKWISVKDRLPTTDQDVLISVISNKTLSYEEGQRYCAIDSFCQWKDLDEPAFRTTVFNFGTVTHWMPLPGFPNE